MLADLLETVREMVQRETQATTITAPVGRLRCWYLNKADGKLETLLIEPGARDYETKSIGGLAKTINALVDDLPDEPLSLRGTDEEEQQERERIARSAAPATAGYVFSSLDRLVFVLDEAGERAHTVKFVPSWSKAFWQLVAWDAAQQAVSVGQKDLIMLLRTDFANMASPATLLPTIRNLKMTATSGGTSNVQHGNESMGKSIELQVVGAGDAGIPEEVEFSVPIFDLPNRALPGEQSEVNDSPTAKIRCAFDVSVADAAFKVRPLAGEIASAKEQGSLWLARTLESGLNGNTRQRVKVLKDAEFALKSC